MHFRVKLIAVVLLLLLINTVTFASTVGKISGVVTDRESGSPLPGVAVSIVGTSMGGLSDTEGRYVILNVPVDVYTVKAELIGYGVVQVTSVNVSVDLTTYIDIQLTSKVLDIGEVQTVVANRPLVILDQTASLRIIEKEEIQQLPTRGYQDVVGLAAGVVPFAENADIRVRGGRETTNAPQMNIRGGRQGEVAYYVDGFSQQDPLTSLSTTSINNNAIEEISISTGGFNAEYGWVSSGAVNITTREGGKEYHGAIEVVTDNLPFNESAPGEGEDPVLDPGVGYSYDYNVYAVNLDGPLLPDFDKASFFVSAERRWQGDRSPRQNAFGRLVNNSLSGWTWQGKLRFDLTPGNVLRIGTLGSADDWREYRANYLFNLAHAPRTEDRNYSYYAKWTSNLSPTTFFEVGGTYYLTERKRGDATHFDDLEAYSRPDGNSSFDDMALFWIGDDPDTPEDEGHVWEDYLHRKSSYYGFNFDITSQVNKSNEVRVGFDYERHMLRYYNHADPTQIDTSKSDDLNYQDVDYYGYDLTGQNEVDDDIDGAKNPYTFAVYLQDKIEWEGLVVNAGIRFDYLDVNTDRLKNEEFPLDPDLRGQDPDATPEEIENAQLLDDSDFEPAEAETKLSPRIGVGFPVSDRTVFHINYGKFFQRPELQYLYVSTRYLRRMIYDAPYYNPVGNPNLAPEQTTAYEVGLQHQLNDNTSFDITAYYKDVQGLTEVINQPSSPNSFATYRNNDFGTIKGLDFRLKMRRTQSISAEVNYSLSYASGTGSYATSQRNIAWTNSERPIYISPLDFDQRHKVTAIFDIRAGEDGGPILGEIYPFENAGLNLVIRAASGTPFTPSNIYNEVTIASVSPSPAGRVNSRNSPWTYRIDLKSNKTFHVSGLNFDIYVWVLNLFDTENVVDAYEGTGQADNTGWLATAPGEVFLDTFGDEGLERYNLKQRSPNNYDSPRQVRLGLRMMF